MLYYVFLMFYYYYYYFFIFQDEKMNEAGNFLDDLSIFDELVNKSDEELKKRIQRNERERSQICFKKA